MVRNSKRNGNYVMPRSIVDGIHLTLLGPNGLVGRHPTAPQRAGAAPVPLKSSEPNVQCSALAWEATAASISSADRLVKVLASRVADIVVRPTGGLRAARATYMAELIRERMTGRRASFEPPTRELQQGPEAISAYASARQLEVLSGGLVGHPLIERTAAEVWGLVGSNGVLHISCPSTATHAQTLLKEALPRRVQLHMLWAMACTGRDWCDFVSYDPRMPAGFEMVILRVVRDEERIRHLEEEVTGFLAKLDAMVGTLGAEGAEERLLAGRMEFSVRVRRQAIERSGGFCEAAGKAYGLEAAVRCNRPLVPGVEFDHFPVRAADGGDGSLDNCAAVCRCCHRYKTRAFDGPQIAKRKRIVRDEAGMTPTLRGFLGNRLGPLKRKISGVTVRRGDGLA